ncbi:hypothetical protein CS063_15025 [Sporanaerobium hydrogeniformans]|uniref:Uncharacterized protein n=1 Tax=Sporanaerobium hydrogeniformans TaxID=3072179 RepID=A0AC61D7R1_9FIRM|nr:hypothetical protein [Sporanaerobium hydrogeniformans]PHV69556.1 hypothetical protein CS063_15025 [Sporanaerobium hydrogeniformans]
MLQGSKEEHDLYISQMIKKIAQDEANYCIKNRLSFREPSDVVGVIFEELEETEDALKQLNASIRDFFENIKYNADYDTIIQKIRAISLSAEFTIHEAMQVKAVALKAIEQLEKAPTDANQ